MKIIEANEGQKISYSTTKTWLNVGDQIMLNLKNTKPTTTSISTLLRIWPATWKPVSVFFMWHRWTFRPEPTEEEILNPDYSEETENSQKTIIKRDPVPFSMDNVILTLFALKEGVIYE